MTLKEFVKKQDAYIFENHLFRHVVLILAVAILILVYLLLNKVENQKVVVLPPVQAVKEFWVQGDMVSTSYLEMMGEVISINFLNVTSERPMNVDLIMTLVPTEHFNAVKSSIIAQGKYLHDNGITQVFYPTRHEIGKGVLRIGGILKQFIGERMVSSALHTLVINYRIERGRFWLTGVVLQKDGERTQPQ